MASLQILVIVACAALASGAAPGPAPSNAKWKADQAKDAKDAEAAAANEAKMAAVNKITTMLTDLQQQVLAEGEEEAKTYNKFACFCKTTQNAKTDAIKTGKDDKTSLSADITKLSGERDALDTAIAGLQKDIKEAESLVKKTTDTSNADLSVYSANEVDMKGAISALQEAIKVLKSSKSPSLVQLQSISKTVQQAALLADALGLGGDSAQRAASFFIQQDAPDAKVEMEDYKFHSGSIIETLEKLLGNFRSEKQSIDSAETDRVQTFQMFLQKQTDHIKAKTLQMEEDQKTKAGKIEDIGTASQELSTTSATLLDDMQYMDELNTICSEKAKTWDQRSKVRANELTAITQAVGIIKSTVSEKTASATVRFAQTKVVLHFADVVASNDESMETIEAEAEIADDDVQAPLGFLQKLVKQHAAPRDGGREAIVSLLRGQGQKLHSTLLASLAAQVAADPFTKIKKLIQELIERLLNEAANESTQKGWCDKATADATQKRQYAADEIEDLNAKMAKQEALTAKLSEEIGDLAGQIGALTTSQTEAAKERATEKTENRNTVNEAKAGLDAVKMAIDILDKFYKTANKESVDLSLTQKGPLDDAPETSFKTGDAYKGAGAESGGIIGMLEVIESDFVRTISETKKAEAQAEKDHLGFMTETGKSLAEKTMAKKEKTSLQGETDSNFGDTSDTMTAQSKLLKASIEELIELKATCIDTGMSYADRVAMREQEISSLKKALCILGAYAAYGPDGLADAC